MSFKKNLLSKSALWRVVAGSTLISVASTPAWSADEQVAAAQLASAQGASIEEVLVTSTRREQSLQTVPVAVTAISAETLAEKQFFTAEEVARLVPNFTGEVGGGRARRPDYFLRGIGVNDPSTNVTSPIGIYIDDVYYGDTAYQTFPLFDLERVEVLRGPQGTLWGKNTIGGAINYISKKPTFTPDGYVQLGYGKYDSKSLRGAFGGPVIEGKLAARVAVSYENPGAWFTNTYNGEKLGEQKDFATRVQFLATPTPTLTALVDFHLRDLSDGGTPSYRIGTGPGGADALGYTPSYGATPHLRDPVSNDYPTTPATIDSRGVRLNVTKEIGDYSLVSITSYDNIARLAITDNDNSPLPVAVQYRAVKSNQATQELRLSSPSTDVFSWTVGGHFFHENFASNSVGAALVQNPIGTGGPASTQNRTNFQNTVFAQHTTSYAVFGEGTYNFTDDFRISGGARWTQDQKNIDLQSVSTTRGTVTYNNLQQWWLRSSVTTPNPLPVNATQKEDRTWSKPTFSATAQYDITPDVLSYARFATGYGSGGFNGNVSSPVAVSVVQPETITAYEAGVKSKWLDGRLTANAAAFYYDYSNIQVNIQGPLAGSTQSGTTLRNAANGKISGAELELVAVPVDNLTVSLNVGLLFQAKYTNFFTTQVIAGVPTPIDVSGNQIARAVKQTGTLDVGYKIPLNNGYSIDLGTDWSYRSHLFFNSVDQTDPLQQVGGYFLGNARAAINIDDKALQLAFYVRNLTDKEYVNSIRISTSDGYYPLAFGAPRT